MKNLLLYFLFFAGSLSMFSNNDSVSPLNDELFSFEIQPAITSEHINIVTNNPNEVITVKIIDKAGLIRVQQQLHLDRTLDVSSLREGFYLIKVYSENNMAIKRFYKGQDIVNSK